ncbi:hypothetical protein VNO77_42203 [Canavalia gladiata]|uniref:Phytocyanin domain-containing protein n=1 Tax=Canavalia gladiata TaxID=3824 RepID=A0AAN9PSI2_CANGL
MDMKLTHGVIILVITASMFSVCMSRKDLSFDSSERWEPREIVVGGSENWRFGYNYTDWAIKNVPYYAGDTLVFKYDAPSAKTFPHNVYKLKDAERFAKCDFKNAKLLADTTEGAGKGFKYVLKKYKPHFFACGIKDGFHYNNGTMKFVVTPTRRIAS